MKNVKIQREFQQVLAKIEIDLTAKMKRTVGSYLLIKKYYIIKKFVKINLKTFF